MNKKISTSRCLYEIIGFLQYNLCVVMIIIILCTLIVYSLIINPLQFKDNYYAQEILYAVVTSSLTYSFFKLHKYRQDIKMLRLLEGYWMVSKNDGEFYNPEQKTVLISKTSDTKVMKFEMIEVQTLNDFIGYLYINEQNKKTGKLFYKFNFFQDIMVNGPLSEYSYFLDEDYYSPESKRLVRIINMQGEEIMILIKPFDQKKFIDRYLKEKSYFAEKRSHNNISEEAQKILENYPPT